MREMEGKENKYLFSLFFLSIVTKIESGKIVRVKNEKICDKLIKNENYMIKVKDETWKVHVRFKLQSKKIYKVSLVFN